MIFSWCERVKIDVSPLFFKDADFGRNLHFFVLPYHTILVQFLFCVMSAVQFGGEAESGSVEQRDRETARRGAREWRMHL